MAKGFNLGKSYFNCKEEIESFSKKLNVAKTAILYNSMGIINNNIEDFSVKGIIK